MAGPYRPAGSTPVHGHESPSANSGGVIPSRRPDLRRWQASYPLKHRVLTPRIQQIHIALAIPNRAKTVSTSRRFARPRNSGALAHNSLQQTSAAIGGRHLCETYTPEPTPQRPSAREVCFEVERCQLPIYTVNVTGWPRHNSDVSAPICQEKGPMMSDNRETKLITV